MKKLLFTTMLAIGCITSQAQIAPGSDAPDFTVTDLEGNTHTLSTYLAQGKTVILDISATWCHPCWEYHESGVLEELYYTYGPAGSDDIVVLFVEGDGHTSVESLYGTNMPGDSGVTQGNWMAHSPYPVIDNVGISGLYEINYFPTIFRICPDGKVNEVVQLQFDAFRENINTNCGTLTDLQQHGKTVIDDIVVCEGGTIVPKVSVTNYGFEPITTATIELRNGPDVVAVKNYTGNIAMFYDADISFDAVVLDPGAEYEAVITSINGAAPGNAQTATDLFNVTEAHEGYNNITVMVHTNFYPGEISWAIKDSTGDVVGSGGPYEFGNEDFFGGGGQDANTTKVHQLTLPGTDLECYSVEFYSANGWGWMIGDTEHGIDIVSGGETIFSKRVANFGSVLAVPSAFKANGTLDTLDQEVSNFALYPNPTTGLLNFITNETLAISILDLTGKTVFSAEGINNGNTVDLSNLQKGMYIARIKSGSSERVEKIVIN
jgi:Secretion system C-terminal sorting domain/Redoxin